MEKRDPICMGCIEGFDIKYDAARVGCAQILECEKNT